MRVLFTTQVGEGHWRPLAPFAVALRDAGHAVAFATTPFACGVLAAHGFACFPAGADEWRAPPPATPTASAPARPPVQAERVWPEVFVKDATLLCQAIWRGVRARGWRFACRREEFLAAPVKVPFTGAARVEDRRTFGRACRP